MMAVAYIAALTWLNLVRGGHYGGEWLKKALPGHPRIWVAGAVAVASTPFYGPLQGLLVGLGYLAWAWLPWGLWYDLGRLPDNYGEPSKGWERKFEDTISRLTPNDHVAFGVRNFIGIIPLAVIVSPFMLIMAPLQVALYEIGWEMTPKTPTRTGEALTGFAFGAMLWLGS